MDASASGGDGDDDGGDEAQLDCQLPAVEPPSSALLLRKKATE